MADPATEGERHGEPRLDHLVRTFITDEMSEALSAYAKSKHDKRPAVIREAIAEYLVRRGYLAAPKPPHPPVIDDAPVSERPTS